ncbi:hypothetical protein FORMB_12020 [Formosa sp. Hel1_33_131]|uniref:hypothetical protein n=1 Tax=Formosa sp. Hel1_33_131 TaxID=1336794 RepID=UPI00084E3725|nr:hypothetical protein [Formosa sp. Hel1_33_131]AOR28248.1 hypothetical protein FORMB_12020 [Formosa sp. Hel1_33_131]
MSKTAAELMAELANNKEYLDKKKRQDEKFANLEKIYTEDERKLVAELSKSGYPVRSVWDFVNSDNYYLGAVPILINHLKAKHHPKILAGLARSLAVAELSSNDELWELLLNLYDQTLSDSEISVPEERGAQESIAVALECLAISSRADGLKKLISRNPKGDGVRWLKDKLKYFCQN